MLLCPPESLSAREQFDPVAEANHRIANHLGMVAAMANLQATSLKTRTEPLSTADLRAILSAFAAKVEAIARLHRDLAAAADSDHLDLGAYLATVVTGAVASLSADGENDVELDLDAGVVVSSGSALAIGLIVCELVTNSIKYAHPTGIGGRIRVACRKSHERITVEVEDDGVGLPEGTDPARNGHLGFKSMRLLIAQLRANMVSRSDSLGATFELNVPVVASVTPLHADGADRPTTLAG